MNYKKNKNWGESVLFLIINRWILPGSKSDKFKNLLYLSENIDIS